MAPETAQPGVGPRRRPPTGRTTSWPPPRSAAGLVQPVLQYALIENALGAAEGQDVDEQGQAIAAALGALQHRGPFEPGRRLRARRCRRPNWPPRQPRTVRWLFRTTSGTPASGPSIRPPPSSSVRPQTARAHHVPVDRWLFPLVGLDASHALSLSMRRDLHRWPAMAVLGRAAAERIGRPLDQVEHIELYSCFPSAVRVQQRELGLLSRDTPTVTGGMAFAGGPFNNFVYQSTAAMAPLLRAEPAALGLVSTVCGLLTKPGLALWSATPDGAPPLLSDLAAAAAEATPAVAVTDDHRGRARVASCHRQLRRPGTGHHLRPGRHRRRPPRRGHLRRPRPGRRRPGRRPDRHRGLHQRHPDRVLRQTRAP